MLASRARTFAGQIACLLGAFLIAGCGGDKDPVVSATGGTSGASSTGGASNGTGGSATTGGAGGGGGMAALTPYPCDPRPAGATDLSATWTTDGKWGAAETVNGGTFLFGHQETDPDTKVVTNVLTASYANHTMHVTGKVKEYAGFGLWFGTITGGATKQKYPCVDASAYKGISFEIVDNKGNASPLQVSVQTHATAPVDTTNSRGGCVYSSEPNKYSDCFYPNTTASIAEGAIELPWENFNSGKPAEAATVDPTSLDGLQWQFPWSDGHDTYDVDVTVSNIKFF